MQISGIDSIPISVPFIPERSTTGAKETRSRSPFLVVQVHTGAGIIGLGEVS